MTKNDNEDFKSSIKCWICDNDYFDDDVVLLLENIEVLHIETVISLLN